MAPSWGVISIYMLLGLLTHLWRVDHATRQHAEDYERDREHARTAFAELPGALTLVAMGVAAIAFLAGWPLWLRCRRCPVQQTDSTD